MLAGISRIVKQEANKNTDSFSKMVQNKAVKTRKLLQIFSFSGPRKFHQMPLTQKRNISYIYMLKYRHIKVQNTEAV